MGRKLVICLDGTGNEIGQNLSNVLKLFRIIRKDGEQQVYYDPGVGTIGQPSAWGRLKQKFHGVVGLALGVGLDENVLDAYAWLCRNYRDGDEIFLFGFSRGAHTARVLAGFIHLLGLLKEDQLNICGYALTAYKKASEEDDLGIAWHFKRITAARTVQIRFLGVWDTVASVIVPRRDRLYFPDLEILPYTQANPSVQTFRQAIALDERRRMFRLSVWKEPQDYVPNPFAARPFEKQDIKQVWFAGVHADIGGGYPEAESGLSKFPLLWMLEEAKLAGLKLNTAMLNHLVKGAARENSKHVYVAPDPGAQLHKSLKGAWYALEPLPKLAKWKEWPGRRSFLGFYIPWAEPRPVPEYATIHHSVMLRMRQVAGYQPRNLPKNFVVEQAPTLNPVDENSGTL